MRSAFTSPAVPPAIVSTRSALIMVFACSAAAVSFGSDESTLGCCRTSAPSFTVGCRASTASSTALMTAS